MPRNKLAATSMAGKIISFLANLLWAVVWLGKWAIRLLKNVQIRR